MTPYTIALTCFTVLAFSAAAWDAWRRYIALRTFDVTEMAALRADNQAFRAEVEKHRDQMLSKYDRNEQAIKSALAETKAEYATLNQQLASLRMARGVQR